MVAILASGLRPCQNLSKRQRELTPLSFAVAVLALARSVNGRGVSSVVDVWFASAHGPYLALDNLVVFTKDSPVGRDSQKSNNICVAHPPCGPWGKLAWRSREDRSWGILAVEHCERVGGVVEQPVGSRLFRGRSLGTVVRVRQCLFGHPAEKDTLLYVVARPDFDRQK